MICATFCLQYLVPGIYMNVTLTCTTYLKTSDLCAYCRNCQEWIEENDKEFKVLLWPTSSPDLNLIEYIWDVLDQQILSMQDSPHNLKDLKDLLLMSCTRNQRTCSEVV